MAEVTSLSALLHDTRVIPVLVIERLDNAVPLAEALCGGGLTTLEITLRTPLALKAIEAIRKALPGACVGAGTIITAQDIDDAANAGAEFLVSPGATPALLDSASSAKIPLLPGASTASEAMYLLERGYTLQKFFPAEAAGGIEMLRSLGGPLPQARFCPTGGVTEQSAPAYLALDNVFCVGGSWMAPSRLVEAGDWDAISRLARQTS